MVDIGRKIKNLRLKNGLTQADLGDRCDLTKGFISRVESGQNSLSLQTLEDILGCLGTNFEEFFASDSNPRIVYRADDVITKEHHDRGYTVSWLVSDAAKYSMEPILLVLRPGCQTDVQDAHPGEEFGYVISGSISVFTNDKWYKAKSGEAFYIQAKSPHRIKNHTGRDAKLLWVSTPPSF